MCFQWSPFQLSGHCPYNRANRPVVWSHTPRRYSTKHPAHDLFIFLSYLTLSVTTLFSSLFPVSSLQCCRAVVPSQLPRPVVFFPTGLMEWSSKIWGEPSNKLEQPCVWSDCFQRGHFDGRPCVCPDTVVGLSGETRHALRKWCCYWFIVWRERLFYSLNVSDRSQNAPRKEFQFSTAEMWKTYFSVT